MKTRSGRYTSEPPSSLGPRLGVLPSDVLELVLSGLDPTSLFLFARVSKGAREAARARAPARRDDLRVKDFVGSVAMLSWAKKDGCPWTESVAEACASVRGNLPVLKHARTRLRCPIDVDRVRHIAAENGDVATLRWALETQGDRVLRWETCERAARRGRLDVVRYVAGHASPVHVVAERGQDCACGRCGVPIVFHALGRFSTTHESEGFDFTSVARTAARGGQLQVLRWVREQDSGLVSQGAPDVAPPGGTPMEWQHGVAAAAARGGHLDVLRWLTTYDAHDTWFDDPALSSCEAAAKAGSLECLEYLRSVGCAWDPFVTFEASRRGHLRVLRWAIENGCEIDDDCVVSAFEHGERETFEYLLAAHAPDEEEFTMEEFDETYPTAAHRKSAAYDGSDDDEALWHGFDDDDDDDDDDDAKNDDDDDDVASGEW